MAEKYYKVAESDLVAIADRTRTMAGTSNGMTIDDIVYWLGRVIYIPQGRASSEFALDFETSGIAILPNVQKASATSAFTLNFETSAV